MTVTEIQDRIKAKYPDIRVDVSDRNPDSLEIEAGTLKYVAQTLKEERDLAFDFLICCFAVDHPEHIEMIYIFHSYVKNHQIIIRTNLDRKNPVIASLSFIYPTANWHERECYDLFGVHFSNHPDLRRLLLPDDWEGYPMRRDYTHENLIRKPEN